MNPKLTQPCGRRIAFFEAAYGEKAQLPKRSDLVSALNLVASEARYVTDRLPRSKGGRPYEYALSIWVANAQVFWGQSLGRKFSLDSNDGEPVSEAARFCWDLVRPLGPDVEFKSLDYTMRTAIAKTSEKENG